MSSFFLETLAAPSQAFSGHWPLPAREWRRSAHMLKRWWRPWRTSMRRWRKKSEICPKRRAGHWWMPTSSVHLRQLWSLPLKFATKGELAEPQAAWLGIPDEQGRCLGRPLACCRDCRKSEQLWLRVWRCVEGRLSRNHPQKLWKIGYHIMLVKQ